MATFDQDIREIRRTVYGVDMREPIADALEQITASGEGGEEELQRLYEFKEYQLQEADDFKNEVLQDTAQYKDEVLQDAAQYKDEVLQDAGQFKSDSMLRVNNTEPQLRRIENRHAERVESITSYEQRRKVDYIEKITHIIHDPPTIYKVTGKSAITAQLISGTDYKAVDSGSSATVISGDDYKMSAGSNWTNTALDDPTHEEYEYITHWIPDYTLVFKRVNEN